MKWAFAAEGLELSSHFRRDEQGLALVLRGPRLLSGRWIASLSWLDGFPHVANHSHESLEKLHDSIWSADAGEHVGVVLSGDETEGGVELANEVG